MPTLQKLLSATFKEPPARRADPYRRSREKAKALASQYGIEIQPLPPGFNVWAPKALADTDKDPFDGNHYAEDWNDALQRVEAYVAALKAIPSTDEDA